MVAHLLLVVCGCLGGGSKPTDTNAHDTGPTDDCTLQSWLIDEDGDGWAGESTFESCTAPDNAVVQTGDCNDADNDRDGTLDPPATSCGMPTRTMTVPRRSVLLSKMSVGMVSTMTATECPRSVSWIRC